MCFKDARIEFPAQLSELYPVVGAFNFPAVLNSERRGAVPFGTGNSEHIGNVLLTLGVIGGYFREGLTQYGGIKSVNTGVNFVDGELFVSGVFRFDDGGYLTSLVAHNTAIGTGVIHVGGEYGDGVGVGFVECDEFAEGFGPQQGHVPVGDEHGTFHKALLIECEQPHFNSPPGSGDVVLVYDGDVLVEGEYMLSDFIALVAYHNSETFGGEVSGGSNGVLHHGAPTNAVHHLGSCGFHAGTSTRC